MVRRTQAERVAATQQALVDAAIELLMERGWASTTAVAVCERAGCTRGALIHHYPSLSALLAHALESLYADFTHHERPPVTTLGEVLDAIWRAVGDPRWKAVLEAWSAAGNDPELALELAPAITRFAKLVAPAGAPTASPVQDADAKAFVLTAREAMLGLALGRANNGGKPLGHERIVLARLRAEAADLDARTAHSPQRAPHPQTTTGVTDDPARHRQTSGLDGLAKRLTAGQAPPLEHDPELDHPDPDWLVPGPDQPPTKEIP